MLGKGTMEIECGEKKKKERRGRAKVSIFSKTELMNDECTSS